MVKCDAGPPLRNANGPEANVYEDDGSRVIPVPLFIDGTQGQTIAGVYAILDHDKEMVYVGMSRDVTASVVAHFGNHANDVCYVKVSTFQLPSASEMKRVVESWILKNDVSPIGNLNDWHEVDEQLAREAEEMLPTFVSSQEERKSPFAEVPFIGSRSRGLMTLTTANVDLVLDGVRPFLQADGGNVSVKYVDLEAGVVELILEGACSSCSSAATTMQLGIEKALRERFGKQLAEVVAVNSTKYRGEPAFAECAKALDTIRDTLRSLGGEVSVVEVDEDEVVLSFSGPRGLRHGVERTLLQSVPEINVVTFE